MTTPTEHPTCDRCGQPEARSPATGIYRADPAGTPPVLFGVARLCGACHDAGRALLERLRVAALHLSVDALEGLVGRLEVGIAAQGREMMTPMDRAIGESERMRADQMHLDRWRDTFKPVPVHGQLPPRPVPDRLSRRRPPGVPDGDASAPATRAQLLRVYEAINALKAEQDAAIAGLAARAAALEGHQRAPSPRIQITRVNVTGDPDRFVFGATLSLHAYARDKAQTQTGTQLELVGERYGVWRLEMDEGVETDADLRVRILAAIDAAVTRAEQARDASTLTKSKPGDKVACGACGEVYTAEHPAKRAHVCPEGGFTRGGLEVVDQRVDPTDPPPTE